MNLPQHIHLNAWTGTEAAHGEVVEKAANWGAGQAGLPPSQKGLAFGPPASETCWQDPAVGYGVLLPENHSPGLTDAQKAAGADAPEPVHRLLAARPGSVVLRWSQEMEDRVLRRYYADGSPPNDPAVGLGDFGVAPDRLPRYVAIIGGPQDIPWSVQYSLGTRHAVGRIPLAGEALAHYVDALIAGWPEAPAELDRALMWTVDHGEDDMTHLMRTVISGPLADALSTPPPLKKYQEITGDAATGEALLASLTQSLPGLVVTSSHGMTGPSGDLAAMRATLGLPVDRNHVPLDAGALTAALPGGCVWFSQACCSAGGAGRSLYSSLLRPEWSAFRTVEAVAALGTMTAPAAVAALGRKKPVRAVIGHVEPTFSWTLQAPDTPQPLGGAIVSALSSHLYAGEPLAYAFREYRAAVGQLHTSWFTLNDRLRGGDASVIEKMTRLRLSAIDRQSLVLLGDPTVSLPALS